MILYPNGAKLVRLPTVRVLQCIAPTLIFLYAVQVFGEPFDRSRRIAFPLIWAVLVLSFLGLWWQYCAVRRKAKVIGRLQTGRPGRRGIAPPKECALLVRGRLCRTCDD
ncbi:EamA family transporter RarD (plasmid) [Paracoccus yeei]|uniref:EamA family transporter RarD n=1 Tax=Paracoccus yeei TaxID=147645 RepID=A0A386US99_9RHOB|nr:EamA family transporter RarD [Paracoccus yeei]